MKLEITDKDAVLLLKAARTVEDRDFPAPRPLWTKAEIELLAAVSKKLDAALGDASEIAQLPLHPWITQGHAHAAEDLRSGKMRLMYCPACPDLVVWDPTTSDRCAPDGARFREISEMTAEHGRRIREELDERWREHLLREEIRTKYPYPAEDPGHLYRCGACRKEFRLTGHEQRDPEARICCSDVCKLAWIGVPLPQDRKWTGFVTLNPHFKGTKVLYLGVIPVREKNAECYWFGDRKGIGAYYAYWGNGEKSYTCLQERYVPMHFDNWKGVVEAFRSGNGTDESWRVAANAKDGWAFEEVVKSGGATS